MRKVNRKDCVVLPLVLKKQWYDLIDDGKKKEEYREYKDFWIKRIENWQGGRMYKQSSDVAKSDVVAFSCGYKPLDMFFICDYILIREGTPFHPEWGEPRIKHFAIGLGERVEVSD